MPRRVDASRSMGRTRTAARHRFCSVLGRALEANVRTTVGRALGETEVALQHQTPILHPWVLEALQPLNRVPETPRAVTLGPWLSCRNATYGTEPRPALG